MIQEKQLNVINKLMEVDEMKRHEMFELRGIIMGTLKNDTVDRYIELMIKLNELCKTRVNTESVPGFVSGSHLSINTSLYTESGLLFSEELINDIAAIEWNTNHGKKIQACIRASLEANALSIINALV